MRRVAVMILSILVLVVAPAVVSAQGLFGALPGLPGLPFGGSSGGYASCGEVAPKCPGPVFYVGWMDFGKGTSFNASVDTPIAGINEIEHTYSNRGLWLGLAQTIPLTERIGFMATGWYLIPSNSPSRERYLPLAAGTAPGIGERTWSTQNTWWYVDGALIFGSGLGCGTAGGINGLGLVLGVRYDYYTTKFKDPYNNWGQIENVGDADVISYGVIPLLGAQYSLTSATTNLVFRIVGVPTLVGSAVYRETVLPGVRLDATGSYNGGHFLEAFAEYGQKIAGPAGIGIWGRWNTANGTSDLNVDLSGGANANTTMKLGLHRSSWSFGGSFNLDFNLPSL